MADKTPRGFARLSPDKRREIATKGGHSVPDEKRSFSTNRALASNAGKKGGTSVPPERRTFSTDRDLAARAGSKGGKVSRSNVAKAD